MTYNKINTGRGYFIWSWNWSHLRNTSLYKQLARISNLLNDKKAVFSNGFFYVIFLFSRKLFVENKLFSQCKLSVVICIPRIYSFMWIKKIH